METYTVSKDSYQKLMKRRLRIVIPFIALILLIVIGGNLYTAKAGEFLPLVIILPLFMAFLGFTFYRNIRKQMDLVLSYRLTITESEITREQQSTPTITINFMEVKEIIKTKRGGFQIKGRTGRDIIHVPHLIYNAAGLEQQLARFSPIIAAKGNATPLEAYQGLFYLLGVAGFVASMSLNNPLLILLTGLIAIGVLIWLFITVRQSKNATASMRRRSWLYLFFVLIIAFNLYLRIAGFPYSR